MAARVASNPTHYEKQRGVKFGRQPLDAGKPTCAKGLAA
jgi:hypothetical protein